MAVKKICVLGLGRAGVPLSAVIAYKCPEIRVTVVKTNAEDVFQWNTGSTLQSVPGLEEVIRKCQNKNLVFTTNEVLAIKEAEIIFILSETRLKSLGEGKNKSVDLSMIEEAAHIIAEHAESSKIVVENSFIPLKSAECVSNVFRYNSKPGLEFQVLSNPEFYESGSSLRNLFFPDCVLIGSENTSKGLAAAKKLASVYERWVPPENIITRMNWSVELSKIGASAMAAQMLANIFAVSSFCEESGGDIEHLVKAMSKNKDGFLDSWSSNLGKYPIVLRSLVYMCEFVELWEMADYWRQVLDMFTFHQERFLKKFFWTLPQSWNKRLAVLGFAYHKDTQLTEGSSAVDLCKAFVEEKLAVTIYDPQVTKQQVLEDLKCAGCTAPEESLTKSVSVSADPYKATEKAQVVVVCATWPEFAALDFLRIFGEMEKPAYVYDRGHSLPHAKLSEIGFQVYAVGKCIKPNV